MFSGRPSAFLRTLRFRLMLWNALAVVLTGMGILFCVREGVRRTLVGDLDQVLQEDLQEIALGFQEESGVSWDILREELDRKARGHQFHGWFVRFYDAAGRPTWSSASTPQIADLDSVQGEAASRQGFRILRIELPGGNRLAKSVAVGSSQNFINLDMTRIDELVASVFLGVLVAAPLGGYLLAGRATRPLAKMIATTEGLHPAQLSERLEIRGTGDELDALAKTVNHLLDRIGDYLRQKHDFLANAAHELRTPLAAIRSSVEVALGGNRSVDEYQELLAEVIDECSSLELLVNQLLILAETDADRLRIYADRVALDKLLVGGVEMFRGVAEFKGLRLRASVFPSVVIAGSRNSLRQVVNNLLDNAVKFTSQRYGPVLAQANGDAVTAGEIAVELERDEEHRAARIRIRDNGVGISAEHLPHIFERFYRVDKARTRDGTGGTGLGLSICRAIIDAHGGTIDVESTPGEGTTFTITLPLVPELSGAGVGV
jgi:two-component system, OmpR family, heavy metal sensor histidine kinase CusS